MALGDRAPLGLGPGGGTCGLAALIDSEPIVTGGNGFAKVSSSKADFSSSLGVPHTPVDSDGSDRYAWPFLPGGGRRVSQASLASSIVCVLRGVCP